MRLFQALLVVLPHAVLTVEVEGVYSRRRAKQVIKRGLHSSLEVQKTNKDTSSVNDRTIYRFIFIQSTSVAS